ncbi:MAG: glucosamine-6-phosphate deaminase [Candidatus Sericytochromatia bacterium]|nr:glucosamine-6-phosphate deaminase [Candidatus Sericytochromatia bacterium]
MLEIRILPDPRAVATAAADLLAARLATKPGLRVALPAGSTPRPLFAELIRRHREQGMSFAGMTVFGLDEYRGVAPDHPHAFGRFFRDNLLDALDVPEAQIHLMPGDREPAGHVCRLHEARLLADGGLDLAVVGIGANGHIAFNEPAPSLVSGTHVATLSAETRAALPADLDHVTEGLSMGLGSILGARQVLLLATGAGKAEIVGRLAQPLISTMLPASLLHAHPDAIVLADAEAASHLG